MLAEVSSYICDSSSWPWLFLCFAAKSIGDKSVAHVKVSEEPGGQDRETLEVRMEIPSRQRSEEQST